MHSGIANGRCTLRLLFSFLRAARGGALGRASHTFSGFGLAYQTRALAQPGRARRHGLLFARCLDSIIAAEFWRGGEVGGRTSLVAVAFEPSTSATVRFRSARVATAESVRRLAVLPRASRSNAFDTIPLDFHECRFYEPSTPSWVHLGPFWIQARSGQV